MALLSLLVSAVVAALPASAQAPMPIRIGTGPSDQGMPLVFADKAGLFTKAGLNVVISREQSTATEAAAIAGGSLDIGNASSLNAVLLLAKGLPFTIISNISFYTSDRPDMALLVAANSSIKTPKDLEGATVGTVGLSDMFSISTRMWLEQQGVDTSTIKYIEVPPSASLAALEQNRIAAATVYEPFFSAAVASGKVRVLGHPFDAVGRHFPDGVLFAGSKWAIDHREIIDRVLHVIQQASTYVSAHESELAPYTAQFTGMDIEVVRKLNHPGRGVAISPSDLQPVIDMAVRAKLIPSAPPASEMICSCALRR